MIPFNLKLYESGRYWPVFRTGERIHGFTLKESTLAYRKKGNVAYWEYSDITHGRYLPEGESERDLFLVDKVKTSGVYLAVSITPPYDVCSFEYRADRDDHIAKTIGIWMPIDVPQELVIAFLENPHVFKSQLTLVDCSDSVDNGEFDHL